MRKLIISFLILLTGYGCSKTKSPKEIAIINIEQMLIDQLHDPNSYKFVSITELDTLYTKDYYNQMYDLYLRSNIKYDSLVILNNESKLKYARFKNNPKMKVLVKKMDSIANEQKKYGMKYFKYGDSLKMVDDKEILEYSTVFSFRANNAMGAKTLHRNNVVLDKNLNVIAIRDY